MPHRTFGAVRAAAEREPITFDFGIYGEETFTCRPDPSLGDTFDLYDAPEPNPTNLIESTRILARFIARMLDPADRPRFDRALKRIPTTEAHLIIDCAAYIAEQVTGGFPTSPPTTSSRGRLNAGTTSRPRSASKRR